MVKLWFLCPSIEGGGVEKNLFLVCNYLVKNSWKPKDYNIIKKFKKKFSNSVDL